MSNATSSADQQTIANRQNSALVVALHGVDQLHEHVHCGDIEALVDPVARRINRKVPRNLVDYR